MAVLLTAEEGKLAVKIARETIARHLRGEDEKEWDVPQKFMQKYGVFVTINTHPGGHLRGCIGYPEPVYPLINALISAAKSAATQDPRFMPMRAEELDNVVIEVTILTPPELLKVSDPEEYFEFIEIGKHGLIAERGPWRGLLLPQVPVEWGWDLEEFLCETCMKAGLDQYAWKDLSTKIYRFEGQIFGEKEPWGEVEEIKL